MVEEQLLRLKHVELMRHELHQCVKEYGFTDERTLSLSKKLDEIIAELAKLEKEKLLK